jgi:hypothetical protein
MSRRGHPGPNARTQTRRIGAGRGMDEPGDQANIDQDYFGILSAQGRLPMPESFTAQRLSRREQLEMGRRLRQTVPLSAHAVYDPARTAPIRCGLGEAERHPREEAGTRPLRPHARLALRLPAPSADEAVGCESGCRRPARRPATVATAGRTNRPRTSRGYPPTIRSP